jgi:uncharacterized protein (TIGR02679 family)
MSARLPTWLSDPALEGLWARVQERLERNGLVAAGRVRVTLCTREERHAASALLGRSITREVVAVDLAELDARLRERSDYPGLVAVLEAWAAVPLRDRAAERAARLARREDPLDLARLLVDRPWTDLWVAELRRTGMLTRARDPEATVREAASLLTHLLEQPTPDAPRSRVELAALVLGDAHALDEDRLLPRVVLRALAAAATVAPPETLRERWELWESVGVTPDGVSATCLTLGLRASIETSLGARLRVAADQGDPVHVSRWDLRRISGFLPPQRSVLVCENPRVLEAVAESYAGRVPVVCTAGEPNTVVSSVLAALVSAGAVLRYHGDFDWPGIGISNRMVSRFGVTPWLMSATDYETNVHPDAPQLTGSPVEPCWDGELGAVMRTRGRALHEETVLPVMLAEL